MHWPAHVARVKVRHGSKFKITHSAAFENLQTEASRFGATGLIVSSNAPLRKTDGTPYREALTERVDDPGVALYFRRKGIGAVFRLRVRALRDLARLDALARLEADEARDSAYTATVIGVVLLTWAGNAWWTA
jgi:hypothetical protein